MSTKLDKKKKATSKPKPKDIKLKLKPGVTMGQLTAVMFSSVSSRSTKE